MLIPGSVNPLLLTSAAGAAAEGISRSLRFDSADSANCTRTAGSPTASGTWTFSVWVKRANIGIDTAIFGGRSGGSATQVYFKSDNTLRWYEDTADFSTTAVFRDTSAWYHFVFAKNGTTSCTVYVNGVQLQQNTTSVPSTSRFNTSSAELFIGAVGLIPSGVSFYGDHYLANIEFVDGSAKVPGDFAETDGTTGQWIPKAYGGSYGSNGFKLSFSDNSGTTSTTLGKDSAGSNNWTPNNFSVSSGAGNDSLTDTPTSYGTDTGVGGSVRGNYCTLNPLDSGGGTVSNGNLEHTYNSSHLRVKSTISIPATGKWYAEFVASNAGGGNSLVGIATGASALTGSNWYLGNDAGSWGLQIGSGTMYTYNNGGYSSFGTANNGDVIGVAVDRAAGKIWWSVNNTWIASGDPANGTNARYSNVPATDPLFFALSNANSSSIVCNWGQRAFAYTAPSGFKALCDTNIPEGSITTSGTFTGNASDDGPFVYLNGVPTAMTINSNAVTFATHADKLANGFKVRSSSGSYNTAGSNTYSITTTNAKLKYARAQANP
jgi:hypothetical protein